MHYNAPTPPRGGGGWWNVQILPAVRTIRGQRKVPSAGQSVSSVQSPFSVVWPTAPSVVWPTAPSVEWLLPPVGQGPGRAVQLPPVVPGQARGAVVGQLAGCRSRLVASQQGRLVFC